MLSAPMYAKEKFWAQTTFVKGSVSVTCKGKEPVSLKLGDILHRGDAVKTEKGSKASFLLHDGKIVVLQGGSDMTMGEVPKDGNPALVSVAKNLTKSLLAREGDNPMMKHLGGMRAYGKNIALAPNRTKVLLEDLKFIWLPSPPAKKYAFTLMGPDDMMWETTVPETTVEVPAEKLSPEATYYWEVRDAALRNSFTSLGSGSFTTLDQEESDKIQTLTASIRGAFQDVSPREDLTPTFLTYQIYREHGMNLYALIALQNMIDADPESEELLRWRRDLVRLMGLDIADIGRICLK